MKNNPTIGYVFDQAAWQAERGRLRRIEEIFDPLSKTLLAGTAMGGKVLEVGPGAGSLLHWFAQVAKSVTALDLNPRFITPDEFPEVLVHAGDMTDFPLSAQTYHLIHARFVLVHCPAHQAALGNLIKALAEGGVIALEDADFQISRAMEGPPHLRTSADRVFDAVRVLYLSRGQRNDTGSALPMIARDAGLETRLFTSFNMIGRGGKPLAGMMRESIHALSTGLLGTGVVSEEDLKNFAAFTESPDCWALYFGYGQALLYRLA